eukprot:g12167.t1
MERGFVILMQGVIDRNPNLKHNVVGIDKLYQYHYFEATQVAGKLLLRTFRNKPAVQFRFKENKGNGRLWWPPELGPVQQFGQGLFLILLLTIKGADKRDSGRPASRGSNHAPGSERCKYHPSARIHGAETLSISRSLFSRTQPYLARFGEVAVEIY